MKLVFISNKKKLGGILTKLFTGKYIYHCGWTDGVLLYDMYLISRRTLLSKYNIDSLEMFDFKFVTQEYLENQLTLSREIYGFADYLLFALKPLYHLIGKSTRNAKGVICSEKCNRDLVNCGYLTPWRVDKSPPSPAELHTWCQERVKNGITD